MTASALGALINEPAYVTNTEWKLALARQKGAQTKLAKLERQYQGKVPSTAMQAILDEYRKLAADTTLSVRAVRSLPVPAGPPRPVRRKNA